jgi:hypothetical protein
MDERPDGGWQHWLSRIAANQRRTQAAPACLPIVCSARQRLKSLKSGAIRPDRIAADASGLLDHPQHLAQPGRNARTIAAFGI